MSPNPSPRVPSAQPTRRLRAVEVVDVDRLTESMVAINFAGDLDDFVVTAPTQHVKLIVPDPGAHAVEIPVMGSTGLELRSRMTMRTYTPRRFDADRGLLEVQFVLHGHGPASTWAARARVGDQLALGGPGGRFPFDLAGPTWVLAGDASAQPAIGTVLDALPAAAQTYVISEVTGPDLERAVRQAPIGVDTNVWVAGEASSVRRIRAALLADGVAPDRLVTRGYWRVGTADHPDHDYGED